MNKLFKIVISLLGGINTAFSIAIPILISLLMILTITLSPLNQKIILIVGIMASIYRGLKVWI